MQNKTNEVGAGVEQVNSTKQKAVGETTASESESKTAGKAKSNLNKVDSNITLENYLINKGLPICKKTDKHIITHCPFNGCDKDSTGNGGHCYITNDSEWLYHCKKCSEGGNKVLLMRFFGDGERITKLERGVNNEVQDAANKLHSDQRILGYLQNERGLSLDIIKRYKLGYNYSPYKGKDPRNFIYIPLHNIAGKTIAIKLRQDPAEGKDRLSYPKGMTAQLYGKINKEKDLFICEGELDALVLIDRKHCAVTSTQGTGHWSDEWNEHIKCAKNIYVVQDNDDFGRKGSKKILDKLFKAGLDNLYQVNLPEVVGEKGDITDYVVKHKLEIGDLKTKYAVKFPSLVPSESLTELTVEDIQKGLDPTIKFDNINKTICFLGMLTAYTKDSQLNLLFNSPSSNGKSHISLETAKLFPEEDILRFDSCSKRAFFHETGGEYDKENNIRTIELGNKIMVFTDQPRPDLMSELRPLLSHDSPTLIAKITDKNEQGSNATKTVILSGFPVFVYCTANSKYDEQEATRFVVLSPEIRQDKLQAGVLQSIDKESNKGEFNESVLANQFRKNLIDRIMSVKYSRVDNIVIKDVDLVKEKFQKLYAIYKPRHQRDNKKVIGLIKALALLNNHNRPRVGNTIEASSDDIAVAFMLWESISESQELGVSPYLAEIYKKVIIPEYEDQKLRYVSLVNSDSFQGIERGSIRKKYKEVNGMDLSEYKLRSDVLGALEASGLVEQVLDQNNKKNKLVRPIYKDMVEPEVGTYSHSSYSGETWGEDLSPNF